MKLILKNLKEIRDSWSVSANAVFEPGIHLITGPVGSGKTTLAQILASLVPPKEGEIAFEDIGRTILSLQFPEHQVTGSTVREEIQSWGLEPEPVLHDSGFKLRENDDPLQLSQGELKRLHLECILKIPCDLLILDEPFSGLDPREKAKYCDLIEQRRNYGITILLTHEQEYFPRTDCIWEIQDGILVGLGQPPEAYSRWRLMPRIIEELILKGNPPENISRNALMEALCRTRG